MPFMSLGFSCIDVLSSIALNFYKYAYHVASEVPDIRLRQLRCEMATIARACARASVPLDVYCIIEEELHLEQPKLSQDIVDHWFKLGKQEWGAASLHPPASSLQDLKYKASRLMRDLEQKAMERRLVLVCQDMGGFILREALDIMTTTTRGRWLLDRIAGVVYLDPIQLCECSKWESSFTGLESHHNGTAHNSERHHTRILSNGLRLGNQEVKHLPGFIKTITIRMNDNPSVLMRQSYPNTSLCSKNPSCARRVKQSLDIRCSREDLADCRLWSIVRLVQGERCPLLGVHDMSTHLNSVALIERYTCTIKDALDEGSPTRKDIVSKILSWTAWSMRPLDSPEMFAALATRVEVGDFAKCHSESHEYLGPSNEEELIAFCPEILEIRQGGQVTFRNEHLRLLIRSSWSRGLGLASPEAVHESMAAVCFHHLCCIHKETILRPWIDTGHLLRCELRQCHLRSYSTTYWQDHYRAAEASSKKLVSMLHSTLEMALTARTISNGNRFIDPISRMSTGIWICSLWDLEILGRTYLEMGADVNYCYGCHEAPLHVAAANSSLKMLRLLLDRGAFPEVRDEFGLTALQQACQAGALDVVALLLQKGADPKSSYDGDTAASTRSISPPRTPLHLAASHGHLDIVKALLQAGSDLEASTAEPGATALHLAVKGGHEDVVRYLVELGAEMEAETTLASMVETALEIAIQEQHDSIIRYLIDKGEERARNTMQDEAYPDRVVNSKSVASTASHFQSLSIKRTSTSPDGPNLVCSVSLSLPMTPVPNSCAPSVRYDDTEDTTAAECGWIIVDNEDLHTQA
ncbi:hypothetical protein GJ744_001611 [Endocarpon pusillum]|uniref:Prion-inhibition and propagation HeLo domain-containing protein n=1 Tax=Endocarpon pusillum TaxID=364733 RepID=A0A8H7AGS9_9EURO|nr:hypothetical protein GJ744_001611 [Endocarpon pusillum]